VRLRSRRIVCPGGTVDGEVVVQGGRISSVSPATDPEDDPSYSDDEVVALGDRRLSMQYLRCRGNH
jgi:hypothetical protein